MTHLHTVYEFGSMSEKLSVFAAPLLLLVPALGGLGLYLYAKRYIDPDEPAPGIGNDDGLQFKQMRTGMLAMVTCGIAALFVLFATASSYMRNYASYRDHEYQVIQGSIKNLRDTTARGGNVYIRFTVDSVNFNLTSGDNAYQFIEDKKNFHNGLLVRFSYLPNYDNEHTILKFEAER